MATRVGLLASHMQTPPLAIHTPHTDTLHMRIAGAPAEYCCSAASRSKMLTLEGTGTCGAWGCRTCDWLRGSVDSTRLPNHGESQGADPRSVCLCEACASGQAGKTKSATKKHTNRNTFLPNLDRVEVLWLQGRGCLDLSLDFESAWSRPAAQLHLAAQLLASL
eukprot:3374-Chlamydomonas_euryale.AAC.2